MSILDDVGAGSSFGVGSYASAAGSVLGGIGQFAGATKSAQVDQDTAARVVVATNLKLRQQERQGYMMEGKAQAEIGASGGEVAGSALAILRSNAANLALDHGIIQMQGSELQSQYLTAASAAKSSAMGGLIKAAIGVAGIVAAPFTGGASLAIAGAASAAV